MRSTWKRWKPTIETATGQTDLTLQTGTDIAGNQTLTVTMPGSDNMTTEEVGALLTTLNEQYPDNAFVENEINNVNPTIGKEFLLKSVCGGCHGPAC